MITEEEKQEIINAAVEKILLSIPDVIGNLITNQVNLLKLNRKFYEQFPEFSKNKSIVSSVVEYVESQYPGLEYKKILDKAVPIIRDRIRTMGQLNLNEVKRPNRELQIDIPKTDNGEI